MTEISQHQRLLKYYTLFGFFVIGVVTVLLGQILPALTARLNLNDAQAGMLFLAQFSGSLTGTLIAARITRRYGFVLTILIGLILIIAGLPGLNLGDFALCWATIFLYGSGLGVTIPSINLLTIEITPPALQSSSINLINFSWGLGAICSQPFVAFVSPGDSLIAVTAILIAALAVLAVCFLSVLRSVPDPADTAQLPAEPTITTIWRRPSSWLFLAFGFFVIGIESGLGGWLTTYSGSLGTDRINATVVFFTFLVFGRGLASIVSKRMSENVLISICSTTLAVGIFLIVFREDLAVIGAAIAGLGTSAIFPTNMVRFTKIFGPSATKNATPLFVAGILGAASLSSLIGFVSYRSGSLRTGIVVVLVAASAVVIMHVAIMAKFRDG